MVSLNLCVYFSILTLVVDSYGIVASNYDQQSDIHYPQHSPPSYTSPNQYSPSHHSPSYHSPNYHSSGYHSSNHNASSPPRYPPHVGYTYGPNGFEELYRWRQMSYTPLESQWQRMRPLSLGDITPDEIRRDFTQYNNFPMGATRYKDRLFITLPRRRPGMPATITYISMTNPKGSSPSLQAYPTFRANQLHPMRQPDENRIVSVYRSRVDECDRLWFVDTGNLEYPNNATQIQSPAIWVLDLKTDRPIRRFEIPASIITDGHGIASITPDVIHGNCDNTFAYLPDLVNYSLHVYSFSQDRMWSFNHNFFRNDPIHGDFDVAGVQYQWNDGIFSITLGNPLPDGDRIAYFHAMASVSEFSVPTHILRNESLAARSYHGSDFKFLGHRGNMAQSAMHAFDKRTGVIFFSQVATNAIACWNTAKPLTQANIAIIARDDDLMIYPADINIDADGVIYVMTNKLPLFNYAQLNIDQYNYRVWKMPAAEAIKGTSCELTSLTFLN